MTESPITKWTVFYMMGTSVMKELSFPLDARPTLIVYKTFRRRPGRFIKVLCTFSLGSMSWGLFRRGKVLIKSFIYSDLNNAAMLWIH